MPTKWGWRDRAGYVKFPNEVVLGPGFSHGPFNSRKAAIENAKRITAGNHELYDGEVAIGPIHYLDPAKYLPTINDTLEAMESYADRADMLDYDMIGDRRPFEVPDKKQAAKALRTALTAWAHQWVVPRIWWMQATKTVKFR